MALHGGVTFLTNQLEIISHGPPGCSITKSLLHAVGIIWIFGNVQYFHTA